MQGIKVIVFDFDGVIVRLSELIKRGAWGFVANHPDIGSRVAIAQGEEYAKKIEGGRRDVLEFSFRQLGVADKEIRPLINKHAEIYNKIVQEGILALGVDPEDRRALRDLSRRYNLYINSGTPEEKLNRTVNALGLTHYFEGVLGQPAKKTQNLDYVMQREDVLPREILFIGDGDIDYRAANEFGCQFLGLANTWNGWATQKKNHSFQLIFNLSDIKNHLK